MRKLTKKEIENAPDWATHYLAHPWSVNIRYTDGIHFNTGKGKPKITVPDDLDDPMEHFKPIPRKEFDINGHNFSDDDIKSVEVDGLDDDEYIHITFRGEVIELCHDRDDIIAMAKAVKLTASDLQ
jgi:hypothetical protein